MDDSMNATTRKYVLITGGGTGIGKATARRFAQTGYSCILAGRTTGRLEKTAEALIKDFGGDHLPLSVDISRPDEYVPQLRAMIRDYPPESVIVNAAVGLYGPVAATAWTDTDHLLRTNIDGSFATVTAVLPGMIQRGRGSIVFISSALGKRALAYNAVYSASKAALQGYADALRLEVKTYGVHVGVVCPARTDTPFFSHMKYAVPQTRRRVVPSSAPDVVAEAIFRCVRKRRREIVVSAGGKLYAFAGVHFPRLMDFVLLRVVPRPG